jgi:hypothetical protein
LRSAERAGRRRSARDPRACRQLSQMIAAVRWMAARLWVGGNGAAAGPDTATALRYVYEPIGFMSFVFVNSHRGGSVMAV